MEEWASSRLGLACRRPQPVLGSVRLGLPMNDGVPELRVSSEKMNVLQVEWNLNDTWVFVETSIEKRKLLGPDRSHWEHRGRARGAPHLAMIELTAGMEDGIRFSLVWNSSSLAPVAGDT